MRHRSEIVLFGIMIIICSVLSGCQKEKSELPTTTAAVATRSPMETITIYSINSDTMSLIPMPVKKISDKNDVEYICSLVLENLDEQEVKVTDCQHLGNTVVISFSSKGQPITGCSRKMEKLILDAFANSILDNVADCDGIIFQCEGKAYKSDYRSFGKDEMYASN